MSRDWEPAAAALETAIAIARESRTVIWLESYGEADLAEAYLGLGRTEAARETALRALGSAERLRHESGECHARLALARALLAVGGPAAADEVATCLDRALTQARASGHVGFLPQLHLAQADLARVIGHEARRRSELREAARLFRAIGAAGHLRAVDRELRASSRRRLEANA